jgi:hypothetical protein
MVDDWTCWWRLCLSRCGDFQLLPMSDTFRILVSVVKRMDWFREWIGWRCGVDVSTERA